MRVSSRASKSSLMAGCEGAGALVASLHSGADICVRCMMSTFVLSAAPVFPVPSIVLAAFHTRCVHS